MRFLLATLFCYKLTAGLSWSFGQTLRSRLVLVHAE